MAIATGTTTINRKPKDGEDLTQANPNLYGYDTDLVHQNGSGVDVEEPYAVHTASGFALATVRNSIGWYSERVRLPLIDKKGWYAISGYVTYTGTENSSLFISVSRNSQSTSVSLSNGSRTRFELKVNIALASGETDPFGKDAYREYIDFTKTGHGIFNVEELKVERIEADGKITRFDGLNGYTIKPRKNIIESADFSHLSQWSPYEDQFTDSQKTDSTEKAYYLKQGNNYYIRYDKYSYSYQGVQMMAIKAKLKDFDNDNENQTCILLSQKLGRSLKPNTWYTLSFYSAICKTNSADAIDDDNIQIQATIKDDMRGVSVENRIRLHDGAPVVGDRYTAYNIQRKDGVSEMRLHTITFKTESNLYASGHTNHRIEIRVRYYGATAFTHEKLIKFGLPKLEECETNTDWCLSSVDNGQFGCVIRELGTWNASETYYNDSDRTEARTGESYRYIDVVTVNSGNKTYYYVRNTLNQAITKNQYNEDVTIEYAAGLGPLDDTNGGAKFWTQTELKETLATKVLLARNASIDCMSGNSILAKNNSGGISAGMRGGDGVQIWAGDTSDNAGNANFRVYDDGSVLSKKFKTADNGTRVEIENGIMRVYGSLLLPNIEFGVDEQGLAVLKYYDQNHNLLYNLGPDGITREISSSGYDYNWIEIELCHFSDEDESHDWNGHVEPQYIFNFEKYFVCAIGWKKIGGIIKYYNPSSGDYDLTETPSCNNKIFKTKDISSVSNADNILDSAWYLGKYYVEGNNYIIHYYSNGNMSPTRTVYIDH